ncbi:MFS transporter [Legionella maceachernii]|uniref:Lysosomal dipeptide transporter MFSD1 n=1 Tax=Legionella maceachernii TaxID=466 RepID=A0A0W0WHJ5_9GAMM|nr:MFS transporter [Legionella maceachernii]KTD31807.1 major facilitator family transporter [Legionella maceachernii]SJZ98107.1 Sugar phosphate permease [Legionella maceachernii]SUP01126.1 sugar phosphate antiporter [Legionella maceachernii]
MPYSKRDYMPYLMWLFPLLFFAYQFILRLWPGLMMQQIMGQFSIDASHFGFLAALYYYGYSGMQIPVAILLERYSARSVVCLFALMCGLATLIFTYTSNWYLACLSRFLVGAGSAVGFLGVSKVVSQWFPKNRYAKMIGLSFTFGLLGAIYGGKPVSLFITNYSWQTVAFVLATTAILLGITVYFFLSTPKNVSGQSENQFKLNYFSRLLSSPLIWLLAIANFLMVGSLEGFADVWGVSYLMTAFHLPKNEAAQLVSFIFVGMLCGGPLLAFFSNRLGHYVVITAAGLLMALTFLLMLSITEYNWYLFASLFFIIGNLCCYQVIVFAAGAELVDPKLLGVTVAFLNCINMLGGSFFHTVIGYLMDSTWAGEMSKEGLRLYTLDSYYGSLVMIPYCAVVGACLSALVGFLWRYKSKTATILKQVT